MKRLLLLIIVACSQVWAQMPMAIQCAGQSQVYMGGFFGLGGLLKCDSGYDWYVDSVNGNDDNAGTSPDAAFATIAKLETVQAVNESVCFAGGSEWHEQWDYLDGMTGEQCGPGAKPLFDSSDPILAEAWSAEGTANVYQASVTLETIGDSTNYLRVWEDDVSLSRQTSIANVSANPGSYYAPDVTASPLTLYLHTSGSDDPGSNGSTYEYNARFAGIWGQTKTGVTIRSLHTRRNFSNSGSLVAGPNSRIYDTQSDEGTAHNVYVGMGSVVDGASATECKFSSNCTIFVAYAATPGGADVTFRNSYANNSSGATGITGFYVHSAGAQKWGTVTFEDSRVTNCEFSGANLDAFVCTRCTVDGTTGGLATGSGIMPPAVSTVTITDLNSTGAYYGAIISNDSTAVITNPTVVGRNTVGAGIYTNSANVNLTVTGADIDTVRYGIYVNNSASNAVVNLAQNKIRGASLLYNLYVRPAATLTSDYNDFHPTRKLMYYNSTEYADTTEWYCALGLDGNSTPTPAACPEPEGAFAPAFAPAFN